MTAFINITQPNLGKKKPVIYFRYTGPMFKNNACLYTVKQK